MVRKDVSCCFSVPLSLNGDGRRGGWRGLRTGGGFEEGGGGGRKGLSVTEGLGSGLGRSFEVDACAFVNTGGFKVRLLLVLSCALTTVSVWGCGVMNTGGFSTRVRAVLLVPLLLGLLWLLSEIGSSNTDLKAAFKFVGGL